MAPEAYQKQWQLDYYTKTDLCVSFVKTFYFAEHLNLKSSRSASFSMSGICIYIYMYQFVYNIYNVQYNIDDK